jgi:DNA-damage-inducible protein D
MDTIINTASQTFESIKKVDKEGNEYWSARELAFLLEYKEWRNFSFVIRKAKIACNNAEYDSLNHFVDINKKIDIGGSKASREIRDFHLSRYACYLIVQNADSSKAVVAAGQTYFAIQTRRQELQENSFNQQAEDTKRIALRGELAHHNKTLNSAAKEAGVTASRDYAAFQDEGYKGLYGGLGAKEIRVKKDLKKSQKILDYMGSTELAANLFRATQTQEKLKRDQIQDKVNANQTHYDVGLKVRNTIRELGGTMPESLPKPSKSVKQLSDKNPEKRKIKVEEVF